MKKVFAAVALTLFAAGTVLAADVITLNAKNGNITFNHKKHQDSLKDCKVCHESEAGGKIAALGKDWAHKTCKGCHEEKKAGPTKCGECHKK
ncbi:MAG TPA: cytochrome c7 [Geobacteraceae bacterium]